MMSTKECKTQLGELSATENDLRERLDRACKRLESLESNDPHTIITEEEISALKSELYNVKDVVMGVKHELREANERAYVKRFMFFAALIVIMMAVGLVSLATELLKLFIL